MPLPNYSRIGPLRRENCTRDHKAGATRLADRFSRGDILVLSREERRPSWSSALERFIPRECCVLEAGEDWITVSVGPSWPTGLWEARRRPGAVGVRLDRAAPQGPLKAQRESLQLTQQGDAGEAAMLMATDAAAMREAAATPPPRFSEGVSVDCSTLPFGVDHLEQAACHAIAEAKGASREMRRGDTSCRTNRKSKRSRGRCAAASPSSVVRPGLERAAPPPSSSPPRSSYGDAPARQKRRRRRTHACWRSPTPTARPTCCCRRLDGTRTPSLCSQRVLMKRLRAQRFAAAALCSAHRATSRLAASSTSE